MRVLMFSWEFPPHVVGGLGKHVAELAPGLAGQITANKVNSGVFWSWTEGELSGFSGVKTNPFNLGSFTNCTL